MSLPTIKEKQWAVTMKNNSEAPALRMALGLRSPSSLLCVLLQRPPINPLERTASCRLPALRASRLRQQSLSAMR